MRFVEADRSQVSYADTFESMDGRLPVTSDLEDLIS